MENNKSEDVGKLEPLCRSRVRNSPSDAGDPGLIPDQGTKRLHAAEQLSSSTTTRESVCCNERSHMTHY